MTKIKRTRFAPTPSGYLHLGNIYNLILTYLIAKSENIEFGLRIDDIDRSRFRLEYLENIFQVLDFLKIHVDFGPSGVDDFHNNFSQRNKIDQYRYYLEKVKETYFCECTRKVLSNYPGNVYPQLCRDKSLDYIQDKNLKTRVKIPKSFIFTHESNEIKKKIDLREVVGDFILWNYLEDRPSYQLVSAVQDIEDNISLVVRGRDLLDSSFSQEYLRYNFRQKVQLKYIHHELIMSNDQKLSKSVMGQNKASLIDTFSKREIFTFFSNKFFHMEKTIDSFEELLSLFCEKKKTPSKEGILIN